METATDRASHWETIYKTKTPLETSWYEPHLELSLNWITEAAPGRASSILDVGGGESTLVDDLLSRGYSRLTVLDIAQTALTKAQARLGPAAHDIHWIAGDVTEAALPPRAFDLWHDRAVFHFLTEPEQRAAYLRQLAAALKPGGQVILATFGPDGPEKCSGLPAMRYSTRSLQAELGLRFHLEETALVEHQKPFGGAQQFLYCRFKVSEP